MRYLVVVLLLFVMSWQFAVAQTTALPCSATDIDIDDDGLIDIFYLEDLNAIRFQADGTGCKASASAGKVLAGCKLGGCNGYELMRDLDFLDDASYRSISNRDKWTKGEGWQPIVDGVRPFSGTFEGNGHTISNLMINRPVTNDVGLFQGVGPLIFIQPGNIFMTRGSAKVINVKLRDINVKGNERVGGVTGSNRGSITNSTATGIVKGSKIVGGLVGVNFNSIAGNEVLGNVEGDEDVGGLVGFNFRSGSITNNEVTVNAEGRLYVGGLAGENEGRIENSNANGSVKGGDRVGGLVGAMNGTIDESHANSSVKGDEDVGGLVGLNNGRITNSYASGDVEGDYFVGGLLGTSLSKGEVSTSTASGRVKGDENIGGLIGYNESPITISYAEGSVEGDENVGGLIGLNEGPITDSYATGNVLGRLIYAGGLIGGNNDDISNSYASGNVEANRHGGGLIGGSQVGRITNSYATGNVTGNSLVGGLIAVGLGDITDSHAKGDVVGTDFVGGLIAVSFGDITDSYAEGDVTGADFVGGLVGLSEEDDNIISSYAEGDVAGVDYVGGLVGLNFIGGQTINSYAEGDVSGDWKVGGLVGEDRGSIANSYASGNVKGHHVGSFSLGGVRVGGLVGFLTGDITNTYAEGDVTGRSLVGGLVGDAIDSNIINGYAKGRVTGNSFVGGLVASGFNYTVTNSYWDNTKTASSARGTGFSSAALKSPTAPGSSQSDPYYLWSEEDWHFGTAEQYPALRYTQGSDANNPACGPAADLPDCDALLSGQRVGLATLILTGGPILLPPFSTETRDYRVINSTRLAHIQLTPTAVNPGATITVRGSGGFSTTVVSGAMSAAISLNTSGTTSITVEVAEADGKRVSYTLDVNNSIFNEGERIVLDGAAIYGGDKDSLSYQWTQVSGVSLLSGLATDQAVLDINLREDLIDETSDAVIVVLRLTVREAGMVISEDVTLTIMKIDNGFIRLSAAPTLQGSVLTAPEIDLSQDPDGTGSLDADSYQWQEHATGGRGWADVGSQAKTYEIATNTEKNTKYRVQFSYSDRQGYVKQIASQVFTYSLDIDVDDDGYIEINDLEDLNAVRYQLDGSGYNVSNSAATKITAGCPPGGCIGYELLRDLDFSDDGSYGLGIANKEDWTSGQGWQPIGTFEAPFNSIFRANGHTISNLYIYRIYAQNDVGLFGATGTNAKIADIGLLDVDITGRDGVGGLVGYKRGGTVRNSYVTGRVAGEGLYEVGGLVGWHRGGMITDSYTSSTVVAIGKDVGGLVGNNDNATITNSYALGSVMADENSGGLVGRNTGTVTRSYATGAVEGADAVGGLAGHNRGIITNSQATGGVTGAVDVGGLVGWSSGDITNSYAMGAVAGDVGVGGFIGNNLRGTITNSYARGNVTGINQYIGGLIGWNGAGTIINSYARGDVSGHEDVGGLVGVNNSPTARVAKSYAVGRVVGTEDAGGLVGENRRGTITKSYWNKTDNPTTTSAGGTSKTSVELQTPTAAGSNATEIYYDWSRDDWDFAGATRYPILRHAVGPDMANPACGASDDLPDCGTLLSGQLPSVGLLGLALSEGATLSPRFSAAINDYHVNVKADATFLMMQFTTSDADATIRITTDGGFAEDNASSNTRILLDSATLITITVIAEYGATSEYKLYVNRIPEIAPIGDTSVAIKEGREHVINVTVSDADISDVLILSLRTIGGSPDIVELTTTTVTVLASDSPVRQSLGIKGLKAGNTMLELTVRDEHVAATVLLPVTVSANTTPTINDLSDIGLLAETAMTLDVTLGDADDDDDVDSLKVNVMSSNEAIATASIAETGGATRVLTVNAGSMNGMATITVLIDDGRGVANSVISETFEVVVEVNEEPVLTIKSSPGETISLGSDASLVVSVADANFDVNDSVVLEVASDSAVLVEPVGIVDIRGDTDKTFVLTGAEAGTAMIRITATDSRGARVSETVSVHVNAPPMIVSYEDPVTVKAGREGSLDVTVSDANLDDLLTLSLIAVNSNQDIVELPPMDVTISTSSSTERAPQSLGIKGLKKGSTIFALFLRDEQDTVTIFLTVTVSANTAPTIDGLSDIRLLTDTETTLNVTLNDEDDDDDVTRLKASAKSSNAAIATASIADTRGATRVLTVNAGSMVGTATITVLVDDDRGVANSEIRETFEVVVEANATPTLEIKSPLNQTIMLGSTASLVVSVADANFDVDDSVVLEVVSSTSTVSVEPVGIVEIRGDTDKTFVLTAAQAGTAMISITATDSSGASVSETVSVHVNAPPAIASYDDEVTVKAGRVQSINVTVSDANRDDVLTLLLSATDENQEVVELATTSVTVLVNGSTERGRQSLSIKGLKAESTMLALTVSDEYGASATAMLTVTVSANTVPTISGLSDIRLLTDTETTLDVTLGDADDDDDEANLKASAKSSNAAIATASIAETRGATRVLTVNAGSMVGAATITVLVDDNRGVANSEIRETFEVVVEANATPTLEIKSPLNQTIMLGSTASLMVSVADANFDVDDSVVLEVVSSTSTVSVEPVGIVEIRGDTDKTFVLTAAQAGTATIRVTATDSKGASMSETVSVHVNAAPMIASYDDPVTVKAGREGSIDVTVSDANRDDVLTLLLSATDENQEVVELATTSVTVLVNGSTERGRQSLSIKGLKAESTMLALTVSDEYGASATAMLTVTVSANTAPTIDGLSDIRLLTDTETTLNVTLNDEDDDDDVTRLKASAKSSNAAIATASIADTRGATRVLTVNAGSMVGTATITVLVDDDRGVANSEIRETFEVVVEANATPTLEIKSPLNQTIMLGSTASLVVSVADANFDVDDSVVLEVVSSPSSVVLIEPARIVGIRGDTDKTFVLTAAQAGTAMISITATDSSGASVSETVSVHVNAPPAIASYDDEVTVKAGRVQSINVTVSDANRDDVLTLLLSATDENQDVVELATTSVTVSAIGNAERAQQSLSIKGLKAGSAMLALTVRDEYGASATAMLTVMVTANTTPTISGLLPVVRLLTSSETTLDVTLDDTDDDDDEANLKASVMSNNEAIATASIADTGGATRVLTVNAGSMVGTAMITVLVDDDRGVANSVVSETFKVVVEADEAPIIETITQETVFEGDTIDVTVSDANNDDLNYMWHVVDEVDGSTIPADGSPLFVVPTDLVKPPAEATTLTLMLTVSDGRTEVSTSVSVLVKRKDNGEVIPTVLTRHGRKLMPPTIDQDADPDGGVTSATYVWQLCPANCSADDAWSDIGEASDTAAVYEITEADEQAGYSFRLKVRYKDGQGYENVIFYNSGIRIRAKVFLEGPLQ